MQNLFLEKVYKEEPNNLKAGRLYALCYLDLKEYDRAEKNPKITI